MLLIKLAQQPNWQTKANPQYNITANKQLSLLETLFHFHTQYLRQCQIFRFQTTMINCFLVAVQDNVQMLTIWSSSRVISLAGILKHLPGNIPAIVQNLQVYSE